MSVTEFTAMCRRESISFRAEFLVHDDESGNAYSVQMLNIQTNFVTSHQAVEASGFYDMDEECPRQIEKRGMARTEAIPTSFQRVVHRSNASLAAVNGGNDTNSDDE